MLLPNASSIVVPAGHFVTVYKAQPEPCVQACATGLILAHFGFGGDDPEEIIGAFEKVGMDLESKRAAPPTTHFVHEPRVISDLFAPKIPATQEVRGGVVWTVCQDGLWPMLQDQTRTNKLLSCFRRLSFTRQWLITDDQWRVHSTLHSSLKELGIGVYQSAPADPFLIEVRRPDGLCIYGFVVRNLIPAPSGGPRPLFRAPRLRRLLLEATAHGATGSFYEELLARKSLLLFSVGMNKAPYMMSWAGEKSPLLPVFADLGSIDRTARELGRSPQSFGIAGLDPKELFDWAFKNQFGIAMGVFPDRGKVQYLKVGVSTIASFASAR
jgi:hypothetical protein